MVDRSCTLSCLVLERNSQLPGLLIRLPKCRAQRVSGPAGPVRPRRRPVPRHAAAGEAGGFPGPGKSPQGGYRLAHGGRPIGPGKARAGSGRLLAAKTRGPGAGVRRGGPGEATTPDVGPLGHARGRARSESPFLSQPASGLDQPERGWVRFTFPALRSSRRPISARLGPMAWPPAGPVLPQRWGPCGRAWPATILPSGEDRYHSAPCCNFRCAMRE